MTGAGLLEGLFTARAYGFWSCFRGWAWYYTLPTRVVSPVWAFWGWGFGMILCFLIACVLRSILGLIKLLGGSSRLL